MDLGQHLKPHKTFRDPVQKDIKLTRLEVSIVDTPEFQRLRRIRQLGTTHLVYPGALHTRFDHALGTLTEAERIMEAISANPDSAPVSQELRLVTRLAALLHDIPHVPFGHTLEDEARLYPRHDSARHFEEFLSKESRIGSLIISEVGEDFLSRVLAVLSAKTDEAIRNLGGDAAAADIVGNTICADLLDYLKRDAYFTGLDETYESRFLDYLYIPKSGEFADRLVVRLYKLRTKLTRSDVPSEVLGLLRLRYRLAEVVYYHHTKMCTSAMVSSAVQNSRFRTDRGSLYEYGDDELLAQIERDTDWCGSTIAKSLRLREIYKPAYLIRYAHPTMGDSKYVKVEELVDKFNKAEASASERASTERQLESRLSLPEGTVVIYCPDDEMQLKAAKARVAWHEGGISTLEEAPDKSYRDEVRIIQERHKALWRFIVYLHPHHLAVEPDLQMECESIFGLKNELPTAAPSPRASSLRAVQRWAVRHPDADLTVAELENLAASIYEEIGGALPTDDQVETRLADLRSAAAPLQRQEALQAWRSSGLDWFEHPGLSGALNNGAETQKMASESGADLSTPLGVGQLNLLLHLKDIIGAAQEQSVTSPIRDEQDLVLELIREDVDSVYRLAVQNRPTGRTRKRARQTEESATQDARLAIEMAFNAIISERKRLI